MMSRVKQRATIGCELSPLALCTVRRDTAGRARGRAHARMSCRGIPIQFVILIQGHEPFLLSNPLFGYNGWVNMT